MYKNCIDYIKKNPLQAVVSFFVIILAYGFYATKYTFNLDQLVPSYYDGDVLITAGRWSAPLIHWVTNWMEYSPFWHTALMMVLFWISGLTWIVLFDRVSMGKISKKSLLSFWAIYPIFPMISEQLTYPILNIALAYVLTPTAIWLIYSFIFENETNILHIVVSVLFMVICIDMYESFAAVFLVGIFCVLLIEYFNSNKFSSKPYKYLFNVLFKTVIFLIVTILLDFCISKLICYFTSGSFSFWYSTNTSIDWLKYDNILDAFVWFLRGLILKFLILGSGDLSVFVFDCMVILAMIFAIVGSVKKRSVLPLILYAGLVISSISLTFVLGQIVLGRMEQALPVFVAFIWMIFNNIMSNKKTVSILLSVCTVLLVLTETQTINNYSVRNYEIFEYEYSWMRDIGNELEKYDTKNKTVVFVYNDEAMLLPENIRKSKESSNPLYDKYKKMMCSIWDNILSEKFFLEANNIVWSWNNISITNSNSAIQALKSKRIIYLSYLTGLSYNVYHLADGYVAMARMGYDYIPCTKEQYEEARKYLKPNDSSCKFTVMETDEMIIVQLMSCD